MARLAFFVIEGYKKQLITESDGLACIVCANEEYVYACFC
jgi:hypothetical protein